MEFGDIFKDKLHNMDTEGRSEKYSDDNIFPYEPTPYSVLERLADSGIIDANSYMIDYGSGMGRACLYLAEKTGCRCTGIECIDEFYQASLKNLEDKNLRVDFVKCSVEDYPLPDDSDVMYFFNPFSVEILEKVMERVRESSFKTPRRIQFFFYYPSDEYVSYLMTIEEMVFLDEIDCSDLFEGENRRERILIFEWELYEI